MYLDEFTSLVNYLVGDGFPIREIPLCFNSSIAFQVDEMFNDRHHHLIFPEFLEALCRVIDIESPTPSKNDV